MDLRRLADYFPAEDIEWKPIAISKKTSKGLAAAYITNRAVMDRLDEVCGPGNWRNEFTPGPDGGVVCGLSIRIEYADGAAEWVTKWDGAENTDIEGVKGGLSSAMRRAAVQWGIGRYLYKLPSQWVPVDEYKRFKEPPRLPVVFLPKPSNGRTGHAASDAIYAPEGEGDGAMPEPAAAPAAQMDARDTQKLMALWSNLGLAHNDYRNERLAFAGYVLGREVESFTSLAEPDALRLRRLARAILDIQEQRAPELNEPSALRTFCLWTMDQGIVLGSPRDVVEALDAFQDMMQDADHGGVTA